MIEERRKRVHEIANEGKEHDGADEARVEDKRPLVLEEVAIGGPARQIDVYCKIKSILAVTRREEKMK